ncbi:MAG: thiamine pyrophosphate-dependent dehydrogenase E1 component subunit alpha [Myxococcota bacterium]
MIDDYPPEPPPKPGGARESKRERDPSNTAGLHRAQLLEIYRLLVETRRLEELLETLKKQGEISGSVYRSLGQEGTAVGAAYALRDGDVLQPMIRDVGAMLTHGVTPIALLRQYLGRATSPSAGRDLNNHFSAPGLGLLGPVSMLGAMVPVLAGALYADRLQGKNTVGLGFIGDGGSSTGAFYEGINFAALQRLPLVMIIEANRFAFSTPTEAQLPDGDLLRRARGFGAWVSHVDGNDALAVFSASQQAFARARNGEGVTLIVADTFRRGGHADHDRQGYVSDKELAAWERQNDPVTRFERFLTKGKHASRKVLGEIRDEVDHALTHARERALAEPSPNLVSIGEGVFAGARPWPDPASWWRGGASLRERG